MTRDDGSGVQWDTLAGLAGFVSWMLEDACYDWVYLERGLEVVRDEDPSAEFSVVVSTTVAGYRALATVGTDFGWFTMDDPDTFHPYAAAPGALSPDLVARLEALDDIPSPSTLGFFRNSQPMSRDLVDRAVHGLPRPQDGVKGAAVT